MIYELRTYTLKAGTVAEVARNAGAVARAIRKDDYGRLEGYWTSDIGPLNQVLHLWSYADLNERQRLRGELAANARWTSEYVPLIRPHLVRQDIRLLNPVRPPEPPAVPGNVYELRAYRTRPGAVRQWIDLFTRALEVRERYSRMVGLWITEAGQPNEVCHIWAYPDLNARAQVRAAAVADPVWQRFLADSAPLLDEMHSTVMLPAAHSPLK